MADTLDFSLVSPERQLAGGEATQVQIPGMEGDLTALPMHAPFLTTLRPGLVTAQTAKGEQSYFVTGGFAEIAPDRAAVLAEEAVEKADLTRTWLDEKIAEAEAALEAAPDHMKTAAAQRVNDFRAAAEMAG
jgi:F-type H+-transporting ATPase subunit epsilon